MNKIETYKEWAKRQDSEWRKVYADKNGKLPDDAKIPLYHKTHLGGHASAVLCGLSRYMTPAELHAQMMCYSDDRINSFAMRRGTFNEPFVAKETEAVLCGKIRRGRGFRVDPKRPWSSAQIDYMVTDADGYNTVLEIKTGAVNPIQSDGARLWGKGCVFVNGRVVHSDSLVPMEYFVQVQKQLYLTHKDYGYLAVWLTFENNVRVYKIERDDALITSIIEAEDYFLFNHLIPNVPPVTTEENEQLCEESNDAVFADDDTASVVKKLQEVKAQMAELKAEDAELSTLLKSRIGEHKSLITKAGEVLAKLSVSVRRTFDVTTFKQDNPEMYGKYIIEKPDSPRLTLVTAKAVEE